MSRFSLWLALLLQLAETGPEREEMKHFALSERDKFLSCAEGAFKKRVVGYDHWPKLELISCPQPLHDLRKALTGSDIRIEETGNWVFLLPQAQFRPWPGMGNYPKLIEWKRLEVRTEVKRFSKGAGAREATPGEEVVILADVLRKVRTPPAFLRSTVKQKYGDEVLHPDGETATVEMPVWLNIRRLSPKSPESVIAILCDGSDGNLGRLAYGEFRDGKYFLLWDSPLFTCMHLGMGYEDVDGDGVDEFFVQNAYGGHLTGEAMSIFNRDGREVTRREPCDEFVLPAGPFAGGEEASTCPIVGNDIDFGKLIQGKKEILVEEFTGLDGPGARIVYRLKDGQYSRVRGTRRPPSRKRDS